MNRRGFLGFGLAAVGGVFVPQFGEWYRRGSGLVVPAVSSLNGISTSTFDLHGENGFVVLPESDWFGRYQLTSIDEDGFTFEFVR